MNRSWVPINTTTVRHALTLLAKDAAQVIQPETYEIHDFDSWRQVAPTNGHDAIGCVRSRMRVPEVIVLARYDRVPRQQVPFTRRNLYRRDSHRCQYCAKKMPLDKLSIDHIVPRSRGGKTTWENCVLACVRCNLTKGSRLLGQAGMRLLRPPKKPEWSPCLGIRRVKRKASWQKFVTDRQWALDLEG